MNAIERVPFLAQFILIFIIFEVIHEVKSEFWIFRVKMGASDKIPRVNINLLTLGRSRLLYL
jgi:hypothetical protein